MRGKQTDKQTDRHTRRKDAQALTACTYALCWCTKSDQSNSESWPLVQSCTIQPQPQLSARRVCMCMCVCPYQRQTMRCPRALPPPIPPSPTKPGGIGGGRSKGESQVTGRLGVVRKSQDRTRTGTGNENSGQNFVYCPFCKYSRGPPGHLYNLTEVSSERDRARPREQVGRVASWGGRAGHVER